MIPATRLRRPLVAAVVLLVAGSVAAIAGAEPGATRQPLDDVRRATARYHDPARAVADGYVATEHCVADPAAGGMGLHFVNPQLIADPAIEATEPEVLLYVERPGGRLGLVAVEWLSFDDDGDLGTDADRPQLFGVGFDGPMPGHEPDMPVHYDLHAWLWYENPDGMFSPWNPRVSCD